MKSLVLTLYLLASVAFTFTVHLTKVQTNGPVTPIQRMIEVE